MVVEIISEELDVRDGGLCHVWFREMSREQD